MNNFIFRDATIKDIPFIVETIIEAEKSGTDKLTYTTIFGLTEDEVRNYLADMLNEEIDGCELSLSSFLIAESNGIVAAALSAWIEGIEGLPSSVLKGNLLNYTLPKQCIENAIKLKEIVHEIHIEYTSNSIQIGAGYVVADFRGNKLLGSLTEAIILKLLKTKPDISEVWAQIFSCNLPSLRTYENAGFKIVSAKESSNIEITKYLPSNKKLLLKRDLIHLKT